MKILKNKIIFIIILYVYLILFSINDNSKTDILFQMGILAMALLQLNSNESKRIFIIFYILFSIFYLLFFIQYLFISMLSGRQLVSALHLLDILLILVALLLPMYILVALNLLANNCLREFLQYNVVYLVVILLFISKDIFGFKTGIMNDSNYTKFDIFLFILSIIQILLAMCFSKSLIERKNSPDDYFIKRNKANQF